MITTIKIDIAKNKYASPLANTEITIDSDIVDVNALTILVNGLVSSAMLRALKKQNEDDAKTDAPEALPKAPDNF